MVNSSAVVASITEGIDFAASALWVSLNRQMSRWLSQGGSKILVERVGGSEQGREILGADDE